MAYESLRKLFYKAPEEHSRIYRERYESEYAVHIDFEIHGQPAFYIRTPVIYELLLKIHKKDKEVRALSRALPPIARDHFAKRCLVDEVVQTII